MAHKITLHEEIIDILTDANKELTVKEIHKRIVYYRRKDGKLPPTYQVGAHIYDYPKFFFVNKLNKPVTIGLNKWV